MDKLLKIDIQDYFFYKDKMVLKFSGYDDPADIAGFIGKKIYIKRKELPPLEDSEFYWTDVIGMDVFTTEDQYLGNITDLIETGSNNVFVISDGKNEILIPSTREVIKKIDYVLNKVSVELIEGLI